MYLNFIFILINLSCNFTIRTVYEGINYDSSASDEHGLMEMIIPVGDDDGCFLLYQIG